MTRDEINELRAKSVALVASGCSTSRHVLWLLDQHDQQSYSDDCIRIIVYDALAAEAKCRAKDATILALSERCAGQSEQLAKLAEKQSS